MKLSQAKRRIILWSMVGIFLTGTLVGISALVPMGKSVREQTQLVNTASAVAQAQAIENQVARYYSLAQQFTSRTEIRKRLEAFHQGQLSLADLQAYSLPRLADPASRIEDLALMQRLTADAQTVAVVGPLAQQVQKLTLPEPLQEGLGLVKLNDEVLIRIVAPIANAQASVIGFDLLYFNTTELEPSLHAFGAYGKEAQLLVVNTETRQMLTYHLQTQKIVTAYLDESHQMHLQQTTTNARTFYNLADHSGASIIFIPFTDSVWGLVVKISNKALYQAASKAITSAALSVVLMLLVGGILCYYLVNPLVIQLVEQTKQIEQNTLELREAAKAMEDLAHTDGLTGLPNRIALMQHLDRAIARCGNEKYFAVLFIDLDKFKPVNDQHGHQIGDLLLQEVAARIRSNVRASDIVGRLGGDEFLMVIESIENTEHAGPIAQEVIEQLTEPFFIQGLTLNIGASVGVAFYPKDGRSADDIIGAADQAMYQAKEAGRGRYVVLR